jgi:hypothetical protein
MCTFEADVDRLPHDSPETMRLVPPRANAVWQSSFASVPKLNDPTLLLQIGALK